MAQVDRRAFGRLVKRERKTQGLSLGLVGIRIGELSDGTYLDGTGVRSIEEGYRAIEDDPELYERVVTVLSLDRDEAHAAWWPLPEGIDLEDIRELRRTASERTAARELAGSRAAADQRGYENPAAPVAPISEPEDLMRSCAPRAGQGIREAA
jgi:hypothetical protein